MKAIRSSSVASIGDNEHHHQQQQPLWFWLSCFFVTVATILGTGILGLPTQLANSGFWPFFFLFVPCLMGQACVVVFMIELLQYGDEVMRTESSHESSATTVEMAVMRNDHETAELIPDANDSSAAVEILDHRDVDDDDDEETKLNDTVTDSSNVRRTDANVDDDAHEGPNLHFLGHAFLTPWLEVVFNLAVMLHFISILSSYALAGPQALGQIFSTSSTNFVAAFVIILSLLIIIGQRVILSVISVVTLIKGTLLVVMVGLTGYVGGQVKQSYSDDWSAMNEPFLVSTVALGGVVNVMPVFYPQFKPTRSNLQKFKISILLGLFVCWILNILWAAFVLQVVPQHGDDVSLEKAAKHGQIATEPLVDVIDRSFHEYSWIAWVIRAFIALSVIVSFVALGSGFKHVLDGYVTHGLVVVRSHPQAGNMQLIRPLVHTQRGEITIRWCIYIMSFSVVLAIASSNPEGFLDIIDRWASLALNLESGFFVALMLHHARQHGHFTIALGLSPKWSKALIIYTAVYFLSAVLYDIIDMLVSLA